MSARITQSTRLDRVIADRERQAGEAVAFEFFNPATGHAIVDYTVNTHVGRLGKEQGYEARPLGYVNPPPAAVKIGDPVPLWQAREALDSLEESARGDAPYNHFAANIIRTALEQAATQPTASNAGERGDPAETADDSDRLKPCPFCGSEAEGCTMPAEQEDVGAGAMFVQCTNSRCMASSALIYPLMDDPKPLLLERWNRRAALATKPPAGEQKPVAVLRFERGTPGRENEMPRVVSCDWQRDGEYLVYLRPQPEQVAQDKPDMFWNDADPEMAEGSIHDVIDREWVDGSVTVGDVMVIQQAVRLPNIKVRLIESAEDGPDYFDYEVIDDDCAARARGEGERDAVGAVKNCEIPLSATPSPQAEKQPLSDVQMDSVVEDAHKSLRRYKSGIRGQQITQYDGIEAHVVRATELAHGIVTKESST